MKNGKWLWTLLIFGMLSGVFADGQPVDNFVGRTLKSFKFEYKVVNSNEEGLTAETAK